VITAVPAAAYRTTPGVAAAVLRERGRTQGQCDDNAADDEGQWTKHRGLFHVINQWQFDGLFQ
jgi:hypothetical protein